MQGVLEGAYRVVERVPSARDHSENRSGTSTRFRIRLLEVDRNGEMLPLALLFPDGVLLQRQAAVEGNAPLWHPWIWFVLLLGLLTFVATLALCRH